MITRYEYEVAVCYMEESRQKTLRICFTTTNPERAVKMAREFVRDNWKIFEDQISVMQVRRVV